MEFGKAEIDFVPPSALLTEGFQGGRVRRSRTSAVAVGNG